MTKKKKLQKIARLSAEEIKDIAKKIYDRQIWMLDTDEKIRFGAGLFLMAGLPYSKNELKKVGMVLGMNPVGDRGINGIPMFGTIQVVHKDDWTKVAETHNAILKAIEKVKVK